MTAKMPGMGGAPLLPSPDFVAEGDDPMRMREMRVGERRQELRHPVCCELRVWRPEALGSDGNGHVAHASVKNISKGGLCAVMARPVEGSFPVRCELVIPDVPVGLPVIMQVRWSQRGSGEKEHTVGLQFLL